MRDLFAEEHEGYLTDPALLDRLAVERLEREAEAIRGEGWKWVEIVPDLDYAAVRQFRHVYREAAPLAPEQQAELGRLAAAHEAVAEAHREDASEPVVAEMEALSKEIDALSHRARFGAPKMSPVPVRSSASAMPELSPSNAALCGPKVRSISPTKATPRAVTAATPRRGAGNSPPR